MNEGESSGSAARALAFNMFLRLVRPDLESKVIEYLLIGDCRL